jgi:hypothetical protein
MDTSVAFHSVASKIITNGEAEKIIRGELHGVACQSRVDYLVTEDKSGYMIDLKTCQDLTWFEHDAKRFGYVGQIAFYHDLLVTQHDYIEATIVAVETKYPYRVGVWRISPDTIKAASEDNKKLIEYYQTCRDANGWPTGYEAIRVM